MALQFVIKSLLRHRVQGPGRQVFLDRPRDGRDLHQGGVRQGREAGLRHPRQGAEDGAASDRPNMKPGEPNSGECTPDFFCPTLVGIFLQS
ncbi:hypothetical protein CEXT_721401 [Caerostris extrusa]|uniref:Uncharacterized protein n=1 Tax=Caerostris extrusa TaxID=172846 RepID=A0AAV4Q6B0_CAEEX|nr:hypothetical protein CEXT_721401 [Caerostris extrusa]